MKYVVLFGVLLVVYVLWKAQRSAERAERAAERSPPPTPITQQEMVRCPVCSVHLPRPDATEGGSGRLYCSPEHRVRGGN
jgi:uncharacterized protein